MKKESSLIKSTFIIMIVSLISRVIGFLRDILIAKDFGGGMYTDAYNIAVSIPETIFTLVGLSISTAFLPMLSKVRAEKGQEEMYNFANKVINILFAISIVFFIASSIFSEEIVGWLGKGSQGSGLSPEGMALAIKLTRITLLNLLFLSVNACFTAMLQVNEDFVIPSILGLFFNLPMILYLILFKNSDIIGLTIANVIGNFCRVLVQVPSLWTHNYKYKFIIDFKDKRLKTMLFIILPVIVGAGANSLNMMVDIKVGASLKEGSISALNFAQKLIVFINNTITVAISSVSYPMMANLINSNDRSGFINILKKSVIYLAILLIPITVGVMIFSKTIVSLVYERGLFDERAVTLTTLALFGYSFGIFFTGMRDILNSTLFSMGKTKITAMNGVIGVFINVTLSITLSKLIGITGIALASGIAMMVTSILLFISIMKSERKFNVGDIIKKIGLIVVNSLIMGIVIVVFLMLIGDSINFTQNKMINSSITLLTGTIIGMIVYFSLSYIFKIEEFIEMKDILLKGFNK